MQKSETLRKLITPLFEGSTVHGSNIIKFGPRMKPSSIERIARGGFWSFLGTGSGRILNLIAMVIAARHLGADGFGAFSLVQSTLGLFGMFAGAALGTTATRFVAATRDTDPERAGRIIGLVTGSAIISSAVFATAIITVAPFLARTILMDPGLSLTLALGSALVGIGVMRGVQDATLAGFEAFRSIAILRFIEGAVALCLIPLFVEQYGPKGGIIALSMGLAIAFMKGMHFTRQELQAHAVVTRWRCAWSEWRLLRDFSAPSLLANSVATPILWVAVVMLGRVPNGLAEIGIYNAAYQWHSPLVFIPMAITSVSLPILAQSWEEGDLIAFRRLISKLTAMATSIAIIPALAVASFSPAIMFAYGDGFETGSRVLVLLAVAAPMHVASNIATVALQSMNRVWLLPITHGVWGITLLLLTVTKIGSTGAAGLAAAFLASYCLLAALKMVLVFRSYTQGGMHA